MADIFADHYKNSIHLPKTSFPMKGNLPQTEPQKIEDWAQIDIYEKLIKRNEGRPLFVMPDGPPYANGYLHLGHVLNKVLKDIVIKFKNMSGYQAAFIPGWDCHGLPIELNVTKKLGDKRSQMSDAEVRQLCRQEALSWVDKQKMQFVRLGILGDWDHPYLTLQPKYEAEEVRVLAQILENGVLYRGEKPVYWCPALQTALAAAEVEYLDHKSPSIYVKFPLENDRELKKIGGPKKPVSFVIWTTTPWTLPANYGICVNADFDYGLFDSGSELLIIAEQLQGDFEKNTGLSLTKTASFKGIDFELMKARHPFMGRDSLLMIGDHVTLDAGTGCVHTAPGHGLEDYQVGLKYGLPIHSPVDKSGRFTQDVQQYKGIKIWEGNKLIVADLKESGHLLGYKEISHSYPHNPRSKTPLIFRSTPQWFIRLDDDKFPVRKMALAAAEKDIQYFPSWGSQRLISMIANSPDWCLSRQRIWGVPIPVFYCTKCEEPLADPEVMRRIADQMEKSSEGLEAYYRLPSSNFTNDKKCNKCGSDEFAKGQDILDVWFDSGVCHSAVQRNREKMAFPADIYLEGSDQHRGWFQTSLISAIASVGKSPYKALITHGFVTDSSGHKMSKSQGNVIDPSEVINKAGAEILRLWVAHEDYGQDVNVGDEIFQRVTETYRRFRNTFRFMLGNLDDFNFKQDGIPFEKMPELDQWALVRLNDLIKRVHSAYENYEFYKVFHALNNFFTTDLSATYLDILKDRLYTWKTDGLGRRSAQTVLFEMTEKTLVMMAPILSFLSEEVYSHFPGKTSESAFLCEFPKPNPHWTKPGIEAKFLELLEIRSLVQKVLEDLRTSRVIGSSLEAHVTITSEGSSFRTLKEYMKDLKEFFIVSSVTLMEGPGPKVEAKRAEGTKCLRCWHYSIDTGKNLSFPGTCPKCVEALG